jgi:hypothetical protein
MTLEERIESSIRRSKSDVFLRRDFDRFGGYDQVGRALRAAIKKGDLVKAGYGVYVRARPSTLTGNPVPVVSLTEIGLVALQKLGIKAAPAKAMTAYQTGATTQMPMATVLNVGGARLNRRIAIGGKQIRFEK